MKTDFDERHAGLRGRRLLLAVTLLAVVQVMAVGSALLRGAPPPDAPVPADQPLLAADDEPASHLPAVPLGS